MNWYPDLMMEQLDAGIQEHLICSLIFHHIELKMMKEYLIYALIKKQKILLPAAQMAQLEVFIWDK